ncbi:MAG: hypothetical protein WDZ41_05330 [Candidatus Babeliales bacterium]
MKFKINKKISKNVLILLILGMTSRFAFTMENSENALWKLQEQLKECQIHEENNSQSKVQDEATAKICSKCKREMNLLSKDKDSNLSGFEDYFHNILFHNHSGNN